MRRLKLVVTLCVIGLFLNSCGKDKKKKLLEEIANSFNLEGNFDIDSKYVDFSKNTLPTPLLHSVNAAPATRTACSDGSYYAVYCLSYTSPPIAAEGDVDCSGDGGFKVEGLPLGEPIGCFVVRYESATSTDAETVGAITIPATNIGGSTDTMVVGTDIKLNITLDNSGTISATVVSGDVNKKKDTGAASTFTAANINGVWKLNCASNAGGADFSAGRCKCFLGEGSYSPTPYANQDACMNDPAGAGSKITTDIAMGVGMYIYTAVANGDIPMENDQVIPSGSTIKAISIWGTSGNPGSYVSMKGSGGEGVTNLGGKLNWATTPLNPQTAVAWKTGSVTIQDDTKADITFALPAFGPPTTHDTWLTWIKATADAAMTAGFECNRGPNDANAHGVGTGLFSENIDCMNHVLDSLADVESYLLPRISLRAMCSNNGCLISKDAADSSAGYYDNDADAYAHIELEGARFNYPEPWDDTPINGALLSLDLDGIGLEPRPRHVFEPLEYFPGGAGFRQHHNDERHYECKSVGGDVTNAACAGANTYFSLICHSREELAIKFLGLAPFDVIFDSTSSIGYARLEKHDQNGHMDVNPVGKTPLEMCKLVLSAKSGKFFAKATKQ